MRQAWPCVGWVDKRCHSGSVMRSTRSDEQTVFSNLAMMSLLHTSHLLGSPLNLRLRSTAFEKRRPSKSCCVVGTSHRDGSRWSGGGSANEGTKGEALAEGGRDDAGPPIDGDVGPGVRNCGECVVEADGAAAGEFD